MQKQQNDYQVTLNYWATVEVTAGNRTEAIAKAHDIDCSGHLESGEEGVTLLSGTEPKYTGEVASLAESDEEAAYVIARRLDLSAQEYFSLLDDARNLRAYEWLDAVKATGDPYFEAQFRRHFGIRKED